MGQVGQGGLGARFMVAPLGNSRLRFNILICKSSYDLNHRKGLSVCQILEFEVHGTTVGRPWKHARVFHRIEGCSDAA